MKKYSLLLLLGVLVSIFVIVSCGTAEEPPAITQEEVVGETMGLNQLTQTEIDAGQVIVIVGFAPLKPAEFVIVRIQQKVNLQ